MTFDFSTLEPQIWQILSAPGTDLTTISAKRVRRLLLNIEPSLTAEFLKDNKDDVDAVIATVFERVSSGQGVGGSQDEEDKIVKEGGGSSRKRKQEEADEEADEDEEEEEDEEESTPSPKKAKKVGKSGRGISDAELARQISSEINGRSRRSTGKGRGATNGSPKKGGRKKKSVAMIDSEAESGDDDERKKKAKPKKKTGGGNAKGGFAKEYALRYVSFSPHLYSLLQWTRHILIHFHFFHDNLANH